MKVYYKVESTSGYKPYFVVYTSEEELHTVPQFQAPGFKTTVFAGQV
jgi:hypothetical protein